MVTHPVTEEKAAMEPTSLIRTVRALVWRDLGCALRNPTVLACMAVALGFCWLFGSLDTVDGERYAPFRGLIIVLAAVLPTLEIGGVVTLFVMSHEHSRGAYGVMMRSGATIGTIVAGKVIAGCLLATAFSFPCFALAGFAPAALPTLGAVTAVGCLPLLLLFCGCGLLSNDQMQSNFWAWPLTLAGILPFVSTLDPALGAATLVSPAGFLTGAATWVLTGSPESLGLTAPAVIANEIIWLAIGAFWLHHCIKTWKRKNPAHSYS